MFGSQSGVVSRQQALDCGFTLGAIRAMVQPGRWRRLGRGVYWMFSGPPTRAALLWAAVLEVGSGAVLSHESAAELWGLLDQAASLIHVSFPARRRVVSPSGVRIHACRVMPRATRQPPRTTVEETVVDLTQTARSVDDAVAWLARACAHWLTTPARLAGTIARRHRVRWRRALCAALEDVAAGCHSLLELRYLRYGYTDVSVHPCATAGQVGEALAARGWPGKPRRCGPACRHVSPLRRRSERPS
jgi:hypothetical protein